MFSLQYIKHHIHCTAGYAGDYYTIRSFFNTLPLTSKSCVSCGVNTASYIALFASPHYDLDILALKLIKKMNMRDLFAKKTWNLHLEVKKKKKEPKG